MLKIYKKILDKIQNYKKITIFTHVNPDGDTIGSSIAFKEIIKLNTKNIEVKISGDKYPKNLRWLPNNDSVSDEYINSSLAILIDTSSIKRTFDKRILNAKEIIKIDHHHPEGDEWSIAIEGDVYPATGQIIYEMIKLLNLKHNNEDIYNSLFVSIWTDTSGLVERNPTKQTFESIEWLEKNGIIKEEIINKIEISKEEKKIINKFINNAIMKNDFVYKVNEEILTNDLYRPATDLFFKKYDSNIYLFTTFNENKKYRIGLRSKDFDVSKIAEKFGGGGHKTSSGIEVESIKKVYEIVDYLLNIL